VKFFHLSDLHIGKNLNGYSLKENQKEVLSQVTAAAKQYHPDAILICGDIYDRAVPSGEAYTLFDCFLKELSSIQPQIPVMIIAGNHDSPERLSYAGGFLEYHRIYISAMPPGCPEEHLKRVVLEDEYGPVNFYLLPFLKPGYVRPLFAETGVEGYEDAVEKVLKREDVDTSQRNVILSHQFYVNGGQLPRTCESEQASIMAGGLDSVDIRVLGSFDYAALGHLHGPQKVGRESVRYCGTPFKYSVSEESHRKSITVVDLGPKGEEPEISMLPLTGRQDVRRVKGSLEEVLSQGSGGNCHDFVSVTVTDETEPYNLREQVEEVYDHLLELRIDNSRTRQRLQDTGEEPSLLRPFEAFCQFYETVRHCSMTAAEEERMKAMIEGAKGVEQ
jgi:exonuclease SbcD